MSDNFAQTILKYLADQKAAPVKPRQLARQMGIAEEDYGTFREAIKELRAAGRIAMGAKNAVTLPEIGSTVTGYFRQNRKGFGFVIPESPNAHGDLFIGRDDNNGAMSGDKVIAKVRRKGKRDGKMIYDGTITAILQRAQNQFVGELQKTGDVHFVLPEGRKFTQPILIRDLGTAGPKLGTKVVVEIVDYGQEGDLPAGVIVETLGEVGKLEVETRGIIRSHGLEEEFSEEAMNYARQVIAEFDPQNLDHPREDLTGRTIVTIDPPDARDYDDAIEVDRHKDGSWTLGVHIADVSHFVAEGSPLDKDAKERSTSVYFPRRVLPMLPEILSNGVCSLQEGQQRLVKSCYIQYDAAGNVIGSRVAESIITSAKRLTYEQAQNICDGATDGYEPDVLRVVNDMKALAQAIEKRREAAGMLHLDLPAIDLVLDDDGKVVDAVPEDDAYTHTIIEMFMVEANEAVARLLTKLDRGFLRRIHEDPDSITGKDLSAFVKACGFKLPTTMDHKSIQALLETVKGRPEAYAVNLAVLKTFQQAEYSPLSVGHFALASDCYCHFTSPIRRYPDLTVHRLLAEHCRGQLDGKPKESLEELMTLGSNCSAAERKAAAAESELREVLILQFLEEKVGETFEGVITGITNFGMFVQWPRFLHEGLLRLEDLGDDWWEVQPKTGKVRGDVTGKTFRLGDRIEVQITAVDTARRQLTLLPTKAAGQQGSRRPGRVTKPKDQGKGKGKGGSKSKGKGNPKGRTQKKSQGRKRRRK